MREGLIKLLLASAHKLGHQEMRPDEAVEPVAPRPVVTQFTPVQYREMLMAEVAKAEYLPQFYLKTENRLVSLDSSEGKREDAVKVTFCNHFTRNVAKWHGWNNFEHMDRDQAGEMVAYMIEHKTIWKELPDQEAAMGHACKGELVIAGDGTPDGSATGHVAIVAPEAEMEKSAKWGCKVAKLANVGKENHYGKGANWSFRDKPRLFLYIPSA